jgi:hypothetical protein
MGVGQTASSGSELRLADEARLQGRGRVPKDQHHVSPDRREMSSGLQF